MGRMLKKNLSMIDMNSEASICALVRYSNLASATWVDGTVLPWAIVAGDTTPENRTYSVSRSKASFFSPLTRKLPFGRTSIIVTAIVPLKVLPNASAPFSETLLAVLVAIFAFAIFDAVAPKKLGAEKLVEADLAVALADVLELLVFSEIVMMMLSPTALARTSSNKGW